MYVYVCDVDCLLVLNILNFFYNRLLDVEFLEYFVKLYIVSVFDFVYNKIEDFKVIEVFE